MADRKKLTTISFSLGDELLDAFTEAGRSRAVPVTLEDDGDIWTVNVLAEGPGAYRDQEGGRSSCG